MPGPVISLVKLFVEIAMFRRGPESVPGGSQVLWLTVGLYVALTLVLQFLLPSRIPNLLWQLPVGIAFTLGWYAVLLYLANRPERFQQTATAVFGFQLVLRPLLAPVDWLWPQLAKDSPLVLVVAGFALLLLGWSLAVNARIVRAALECTPMAAAGLVLAEFLTSQVLFLAMIGPPPEAAVP